VLPAPPPAGARAPGRRAGAGAGGGGRSLAGGAGIWIAAASRAELLPPVLTACSRDRLCALRAESAATRLLLSFARPGAWPEAAALTAARGFDGEGPASPRGAGCRGAAGLSGAGGVAQA
jgi:hypothetical protein